MSGTHRKGPSSRTGWLVWNAARILPPLLLLISIACGDILLPPLPEPPGEGNPCDPNSSSFIPPNTVIISPTEGEEFNQDSVTITWRAGTTRCSHVFRSRLDGGAWTSWSTVTTRTLQHMDDNLPGESYTFEVQAAYDPTHSSMVQTTPTSVPFTVDAVDGPSFRLSPLYSEGSSGNLFSLDLMAEEVTNLMMIKAVITFNTSLVTVQSWELGDFLGRNGGTLLTYDQTDNIAGRFEINLSVVGGTPEGVTGSGTLVTIHFRGQGSGLADIDFDVANTLMRNPSNAAITILHRIGAQIRVY